MHIRMCIQVDRNWIGSGRGLDHVACSVRMASRSTNEDLSEARLGESKARSTPGLLWYVTRLFSLAFSELSLTSHDVIDASNWLESARSCCSADTAKLD